MTRKSHSALLTNVVADHAAGDAGQDRREDGRLYTVARRYAEVSEYSEKKATFLYVLVVSSTSLFLFAFTLLSIDLRKLLSAKRSDEFTHGGALVLANELDHRLDSLGRFRTQFHDSLAEFYG